MRTRVWLEGRLDLEGFPLAELSDQLERDGTFVWLDLSGPDELGKLDLVCEELGLDQLSHRGRGERARTVQAGPLSRLPVP